MFCNVCSQGDKLFHASGLATELFFRCSVVLGPDRGQNGTNRACALLLASSLLLAMAGSRKLPAARTPMPGSHSPAGQSVRLITVRSAVQARVGPCMHVWVMMIHYLDDHLIMSHSSIASLKSNALSSSSFINAHEKKKCTKNKLKAALHRRLITGIVNSCQERAACYLTNRFWRRRYLE